MGAPQLLGEPGCRYHCYLINHLMSHGTQKPWHRSKHILRHTPSKLAVTSTCIVNQAIEWLGAGELYRVINAAGVGIRTAPIADAKSTKPNLDGGDLFVLAERANSADGVWGRYHSCWLLM